MLYYKNITHKTAASHRLQQAQRHSSNDHSTHAHTHTHMTRNNYRSPDPSTSLHEHTAHPIWWYLLACTIDVPCRQCDPRLRHDPIPRHTAARTEGLTQQKPKPKNISNAAAPRSRPLPVNVYVGEALQTSTVEADEVEALVKCVGPVVVVHGFVVGVSPPGVSGLIFSPWRII